MAAALVLLLLPPSYSRRLKNPLQLLVPMQWFVHTTAMRAQQSVRGAAEPAVSAEQYSRVEAERRALENRLVAIETTLAELQQALQAVSGWRGRGLPPEIRLIHARVVAADAAGWRESILVDRGSSDGVEVGDWVVTHAWLPPAADGAQAGADLLSRECLIGQVAETTPLTARVVLLTDAEHRRAPARVRIARIEAGHVAATEEFFALYGRGNGKLTVPEVPARLFDTGKIRVGDLVVSSTGDPRLPIAVVIGEVARIESDPGNPLLYHLDVRPRLDARTVRRVYIVDASPGRGPDS